MIWYDMNIYIYMLYATIRDGHCTAFSVWGINIFLPWPPVDEIKDMDGLAWNYFELGCRERNVWAFNVDHHLWHFQYVTTPEPLVGSQRNIKILYLLACNSSTSFCSLSAILTQMDLRPRGKVRKLAGYAWGCPKSEQIVYSSAASVNCPMGEVKHTSGRTIPGSARHAPGRKVRK